MSWLPTPEQRSRKDLLATIVLVLVASILLAGIWLTSQQRKIDHSLADTPASVAKGATQGAVPQLLREAWTHSTEAPSLIARESGALVVNDSRVTTIDALTGAERWHYDQQREICGLASPSKWQEVAIVFRGPKGCGEVISFDLASGQYAHTRDALGPENVTVFAGNRRAGTYAPERVELWRDDLVLTVEVGQQEAPHQPNQQTYTECSITSVQAHEDLLVTAQQCPQKKKKLVRLLKATPEESETPEVLHEYTVPAGAEVVSATDKAALIYIPPSQDKGPRTQLLQDDGTFETQPSSAAGDVELKDRTAHEGALAMWFDGTRLRTYDAETLKPAFTVEGALGTGAMMGGKLLVPVNAGIAVIDPTRGTRERIIPVDRGTYRGEVTLKAPAHGAIVERRGDTVVGLVDQAVKNSEESAP